MWQCPSRRPVFSTRPLLSWGRAQREFDTGRRRADTRARLRPVVRLARPLYQRRCARLRPSSDFSTRHRGLQLGVPVLRRHIGSGTTRIDIGTSISDAAFATETRSSRSHKRVRDRRPWRVCDPYAGKRRLSDEPGQGRSPRYRRFHARAREAFEPDGPRIFRLARSGAGELRSRQDGASSRLSARHTSTSDRRLHRPRSRASPAARASDFVSRHRRSRCPVAGGTGPGLSALSERRPDLQYEPAFGANHRGPRIHERGHEQFVGDIGRSRRTARKAHVLLCRHRRS